MMAYLALLPDAFFVGVALIASVCLVRSGLTPRALGAVLGLLVICTLSWVHPIAHHPIGRLLPAVIAFWFLPGYILIEWLFPAQARRLDSLERVTIAFSLSIAVWVVTALVAYRLEPSSAAVAAAVLAAETGGVLALARRRRSAQGLNPPISTEREDISTGPYLFALAGVLLLVSAAVGWTSQFQRYDFDSSWHLVGYNKAALSDRVVSVNPYLGPGYSYLQNYLTNPVYLAVGLTARISHAPVTWLYVCVATLFTPVFFLSLYSLVKALASEAWIGVVATLLAIGPWIAQATMAWGPPMGGFYLQFLPIPGEMVQLILIPVWLAFAVRLVAEREGESWGLGALLALAAFGSHPMGLFVLSYIMAILLVTSLWFRRAPMCRRRALALSVLMLAAAAVLGYSLYHPPHMSSWIGIGVSLRPDDYLSSLLKASWILAPGRYAISPATLLDPLNVWMFAGAAVLALATLWLPNRAAAMPTLRWPRAIALLAMAVGPFALVCNPYLVPAIVAAVGPLPPSRMIGQFEVFRLACQYGAIAMLLWLAARFMSQFAYGRALCGVCMAGIIAAALLLPFRGPQIQGILARIFRNQNPSILAASADPLYKALASLEPGIVAIEEPRSEFMLMTTPHYAVSSTRMIEQRQRDNDAIVRFSLPFEQLKQLINKYRVTYVITRRDTNANEVANGDFSNGTAGWDAVVSSSLSASDDGQNDAGLALDRLGYDSQIAYQNVVVRAGGRYELEGFVKSGTSGDEPFAIQIFGQNVSGAAAIVSIEGRTKGEWTHYSVVFTAPEKALSIVLRKNSPSPGSMLFDGLALVETALAVQRYQGYPAVFPEVITTPGHVVFAVVRQPAHVVDSSGHSPQNAAPAIMK